MLRASDGEASTDAEFSIIFGWAHQQVLDAGSKWSWVFYWMGKMSIYDVGGKNHILLGYTMLGQLYHDLHVCITGTRA